MQRRTYQFQGFNDWSHTIFYTDNNMRNEIKMVENNPYISDLKDCTMSLCQNLVGDEKINFNCNCACYLQIYAYEVFRLFLDLAIHFLNPRHRKKHQLWNLRDLRNCRSLIEAEAFQIDQISIRLDPKFKLRGSSLLDKKIAAH
jgi:hypothetical protein